MPPQAPLPRAPRSAPDVAQLEALEPRQLFSASVVPGMLTPLHAASESALHAGLLDPTHASPLPPANSDGPGASALRGGGAFALSQVPVLHSNPTSDHTIYLDFNGMTVVDTLWNTNYHGGNPIHAPAFDLDGDIDSFSQQELDQIVEIWQRVSEDFAPFDLDVTTEPPPEAHFSEGSRAIRILISSNRDHADLGGDGTRWYQDAGGVARIGSWRYTSDTPAWVFSNLLQGSAKYVAEAVSHETGHTLGLHHDGIQGGEEYFAGHGSGATSWAPIMGSSYTRQVTQWSQGEYSNADNPEDDLSIITQSANGVTYRADDHGNTRDDASVITPLVGGRSIGASGIITTSADVDYFAFETADGEVDLQLNPAAVGANLDIKARLFDASGHLVATSDPANQLGAGFTLTLDAGWYYLAIEGTGNPGASGYSGYASLGQYHIVGSVQPAATVHLPAPLAGDADGDYRVGGADLSLITGAWGQQGVGLAGDVNHDGVVGVEDLDLVLAQWGTEADVPTDGVSRVRVPTDGTLGLSWTQPGFDAGGWGFAVPGVGYEAPGGELAGLIETELPEATVGAYLRTVFESDGSAGVEGMGLTIRFDDGFVAYLNGVQVASHHAPDEPQWDSLAAATRDDDDAQRFAWFDLTRFLPLLVAGENTLAVHVMNASPSSSDLLLDAELVTWSPVAGDGLAGLPATGPAGGGPQADAAAPTPGVSLSGAAAAWMSRKPAADALALAQARPAGPQRGVGTMPRRVADLLR
ncbi:MAG: zinc-dependent metalloprotease family protein [Phycisphaerales bacterium JB063]